MIPKIPVERSCPCGIGVEGGGDRMSLLVVGTVALDTVETPFGKVEEALGGTASYFAFAARHYTDVKIVGVVGDDFPTRLPGPIPAKQRGCGGAGEKIPGNTFRWSGYYNFDLNTAHTLETQLNVLVDFQPKLPEATGTARLVFLGNIAPGLQKAVLAQASSPKLTVLDSMNFWIERDREALTEVMKMVDVVLLNEAEVRSTRRRTI